MNPLQGIPDVPPNPKAYPREELEEMMRRWLEANRQAEAKGDWITTLGAHYTDDAIYRWNVGPNQEFVADGIEEIRELALGLHMSGFEGYAYPYDKVLIDEAQGEIVAFWRQVAPVKRADGTPIEVTGVGGSWFKYGGDYKWSWQRDFFDLGNVFAMLAEVAGEGALSKPVKERIHIMAKGGTLPGHRILRPSGGLSGIGSKAKQGIALAKAALFGR